MELLVVENEATTARLLQSVLTGAGYKVTLAENGVQALDAMRRATFEAVVTDWMMPEMDGIQLMLEIRKLYKTPPLLMMVTAIADKSAESFALDSGADEFVRKPINPKLLKQQLELGLAKRKQTSSSPTFSPPKKGPTVSPSPSPPTATQAFSTNRGSCIGIAASTGGPPVLSQIMKNLPAQMRSTVFLCLHGPQWMLETYATRLAKDSKLGVHIAQSGQKPELGCAYLAPGDVHLTLDSRGTMQLNSDPLINFVRPSADPLFQSIANHYGPRSVGVVLTGLGCDGAVGVQAIAASGGRILVQSPDTAVAPSMPRAALQVVPGARVETADRIPAVLQEMLQTTRA